MTKLTRVIQRIFGDNAGVNQRAQIGSLAAASPVFTTDPTVMQALAEYTDGLDAILIGSNSPAKEDFNSLLFLFSRQLAYIFQAGVPEWQAVTTYYIGSIVQDGLGNGYISILDNNTGNALGGDGWFPYGSNGVLNAVVGSGTLIAGSIMNSPSPITLNASTTLNVPATTQANVPTSLVVPAGSSLIVAPGGKMRVYANG